MLKIRDSGFIWTNFKSTNILSKIFIIPKFILGIHLIENNLNVFLVEMISIFTNWNSAEFLRNEYHSRNENDFNLEMFSIFANCKSFFYKMKIISNWNDFKTFWVGSYSIVLNEKVFNF